MKVYFFILLVFFSFSVFGSEVVLLEKSVSSRGPRGAKLVAVEKVSTNGSEIVVRELFHPSRLGITVLDAAGNATIGLIKTDLNDLIQVTNEKLSDKEGNLVGLGSKVRVNIKTGRRSKMVTADVLITFKSGHALVSVDPNFTEIIKSNDLITAIKMRDYFCLKVINVANAVLEN